MTISKTSVSVLASVSVPAGGTKASPQAAGTGAAVDCRTYYGGELTFKLTNGASAPTVPPALTFQASPDGTAWYDYYTVGGDTVANSVTSGSIALDRGVMYARAIVYANATNAVTAEAGLQAVSGI